MNFFQQSCSSCNPMGDCGDCVHRLCFDVGEILRLQTFQSGPTSVSVQQQERRRTRNENQIDFLVVHHLDQESAQMDRRTNDWFFPPLGKASPISIPVFSPASWISSGGNMTRLFPQSCHRCFSPNSSPKQRVSTDGTTSVGCVLHLQKGLQHPLLVASPDRTDEFAQLARFAIAMSV